MDCVGLVGCQAGRKPFISDLVNHMHMQLERVKKTRQMFIVVVCLLMFANKGRQDIAIQGVPQVTIYF